jgi:Fe-S-cluster containining protein
LDVQFLRLHNELFASYDCCRCANCCRKAAVPLDQKEIAVIARFLSQSVEDFVVKHLVKSEEDAAYELESPCAFLAEDGKCQIENCKPATCRGYPLTDKPKRLHSMFSVLDAAQACPVVFELLERLKRMCRFSPHR